MNKRICTLILSVLTILAIFTVFSYGESAVSNVSTNCSVTSFSAGDEVRLQVSTKEMSICTFIAYVEYDGELLEYQGFEGAFEDDKETAYLKCDSKREKYVQVTVEHAEDRSLVGMYSVGTEEKKYLATDPLVTLIFKAKTSGTVDSNSFVVAETSDGTDGYTSESIKQASGVDSEANSTATENSKGTISRSNSDNRTPIIITTITIVIVITIIAVVFIKKKKHHNKHK